MATTTEIKYEASLFNGSERVPNFEWRFRVPTPLFMSAKAGNSDAAATIGKLAVNTFGPRMLRSEPLPCFHCGRPAQHIVSNFGWYGLDPRAGRLPVEGPFIYDQAYVYCSKGGECDAAVRAEFEHTLAALNISDRHVKIS